MLNHKHLLQNIIVNYGKHDSGSVVTHLLTTSNALVVNSLFDLRHAGKILLSPPETPPKFFSLTRIVFTVALKTFVMSAIYDRLFYHSAPIMKPFVYVYIRMATSPPKRNPENIFTGPPIPQVSKS